jgi:hypothetical protein
MRDRLFKIGEVLLVSSAIFIGLFLATNLASLTYFISFVGGFAILGFVSLVFGFILTIINAYMLDPETNITKRKRHILTLVTALFMVLSGYSISTNAEWTIRPLIIENIAGITINPSYAFYPEIIIASNTLFYTSILTFGILVIPFIFAEAGLLDYKTDIKAQDYNQGQTLEEAEKIVDIFTAILKFKIGPKCDIKNTRILKMLKKLTIPAASAFAVAGFCLIVLPNFLVKDGPLTVDQKGVEYIKNYMGVLRGQLLLLGILFLIVVILLIFLHRKTRSLVLEVLLFNFYCN